MPIKSLKIKNFHLLKKLEWKYDKCYQKSRILPDISNLREFHYYQAEQNNCLVKLNFDSDKSNLEKLSIRNTQLGSKELLQFSSQFQNLKELKLQDNRIEDLEARGCESHKNSSRQSPTHYSLTLHIFKS